MNFRWHQTKSASSRQEIVLIAVALVLTMEKHVEENCPAGSETKKLGISYVMYKIRHFNLLKQLATPFRFGL